MGETGEDYEEYEVYEEVEGPDGKKIIKLKENIIKLKRREEPEQSDKEDKKQTADELDKTKVGGDGIDLSKSKRVTQKTTIYLRINHLIILTMKKIQEIIDVFQEEI